MKTKIPSFIVALVCAAGMISTVMTTPVHAQGTVTWSDQFNQPTLGAQWQMYNSPNGASPLFGGQPQLRIIPYWGASAPPSGIRTFTPSGVGDWSASVAIMILYSANDLIFDFTVNLGSTSAVLTFSNMNGSTVASYSSLDPATGTSAPSSVHPGVTSSDPNGRDFLGISQTGNYLTYTINGVPIGSYAINPGLHPNWIGLLARSPGAGLSGILASDFTVSYSPVAAVPEPSTWVLVLFGLVVLIGGRLLHRSQFY
ncbi:MAG: hypothetical protein RIT04_666 [Candidatus Parcubacteria bacterium]